jgi:hypothetical protein
MNLQFAAQRRLLQKAINSYPPITIQSMHIQSKYLLRLLLLAGLFSCESKPGNGKEEPVTASNSAAADDLYIKYRLDQIQLPPGFSISVFAAVPDARSLCWGANGTLFAV